MLLPAAHAYSQLSALGEGIVVVRAKRDDCVGIKQVSRLRPFQSHDKAWGSGD